MSIPRRVGTALALVVLAVALAVGVFPRGAVVQASVSGTFDCGSGFHGCGVYLAIRPGSWSAPAGWNPGKADLRIPAASDGAGHWTLDGAAGGGNARLGSGEYAFLVAVSEVDDTRPLVLGTDDQPTTGLLGTSIRCRATAVVNDSVKIVRVVAVLGPDCVIEVDLSS